MELPAPITQGYRAAVPSTPNYGPAPWDDPSLRGKWGLYAPVSDRWLPLVLSSEREALELAKVLRQARSRPR